MLVCSPWVVIQAVDQYDYNLLSALWILLIINIATNHVPLKAPLKLVYKNGTLGAYVLYRIGWYYDILVYCVIKVPW